MKAKMWVLKGLTFLVSIAPLSVYLGIEHERYFQSPTTGFAMGAFVAIIFATIALKDRLAEFLHGNTQLKVSLIFLFVFWFVRNIANDVLIISAFSAIGSVISILPSHFATKFQKRIAMTEQADISGTAFAKAFVDNNIGNNNIKVVKKK